MQIIHTKKELQEAVSALKKEGNKIGFVPTMGALHEGHLSLVDVARGHSDKVVASIFVNPAQFAPHEDFDAYPRQNEEDIAKFKERGVDIVYVPKPEEIFPKGFDIKISVGDIGQILEGVTRPHFFDGIALVITKFYMQVTPDVAVFGEKDFQQLHIMKKLAHLLDMPVEVIGAPIMREENGLAMASRNLYLTDEQKNQAAGLYEVLQQVRDDINNGVVPDDAIAEGEKTLLAKGFEKVDYFVLCDADTLGEVTPDTKNKRLIVTAYLCGVRLLDNMAI